MRPTTTNQTKIRPKLGTKTLRPEPLRPRLHPLMVSPPSQEECLKDSHKDERAVRMNSISSW
jgi:hypothetical protein